MVLTHVLLITSQTITHQQTLHCLLTCSHQHRGAPSFAVNFPVNKDLNLFVGPLLLPVVFCGAVFLPVESWKAASSAVGTSIYCQNFTIARPASGCGPVARPPAGGWWCAYPRIVTAAGVKQGSPLRPATRPIQPGI